MEYHAENAGTPYEVLLGLLGRDVRRFDLSLGLCADVVGPLRKTAQAYAGSFGCATPLPQINIPIAVQPFERGVMVWVSMLPTFSRGDFSGPTIFVIYFDNQRNRLVWEGYSRHLARRHQRSKRDATGWPVLRRSVASGSSGTPISMSAIRWAGALRPNKPTPGSCSPLPPATDAGCCIAPAPTGSICSTTISTSTTSRVSADD